MKDTENLMVIKSFKYNGHIHRIWYENWSVPSHELHDLHAEENMHVLVNHGTRIREADGKEWVSKVPGVTFFIPGAWYNIVALLESSGVRYYCNVASPFYKYDNVITYIDYDLDAIRLPDGSYHIVDEEEYHSHRVQYQYPGIVETKVQSGLEALIDRLKGDKPPFQDGEALRYYRLWENRMQP
jgi:protein associated with RNAse G/E